ncbi:hypothetical protein VTK26DRAFT_7864 [Humicola hyalothermophila]
MKTAKPSAPEGATGPSRRAQPVRQTRINPPRTSSLNRANPLAGAPAPEQPINILPGVTHFADAITALPKELVRHFTLLKEVDAKIFAPEAALFQLLHNALNTPVPDVVGPHDSSSGSAALQSAPMIAQNSSTGAADPCLPPRKHNPAVFDPANIPRRTLFRDTALKIQEMLVSLEEKNHVISTANDALQKQLGRIEEIWPHLEAEFSDEAKWGSTTHWAYVENRQAKANDKQAERSRREGAATLSAAAQALAEEAAARSNDRKQAIAAKKNARNQAADADGDKAQEGGKKAAGGGKARKPLPDSAAPVGLGISPGPSGTGSGPSKRRKVETAKASGTTPSERAMSNAAGNSASKQKTMSPRETPVPEATTKKRKALPGGPSQAKKSRTNAPSATSSPVIGTLPDPVKAGRGSPAPTSAPRPASSRARQNSTQSNDNVRQRAPSATSSKPNGNSEGTPEPGQPNTGAKQSSDWKGQKETTMAVLSKPNPVKPNGEEAEPVPEPAQNGESTDSATKSNEDREQPKKQVTSLAIQPTPPTVKTKSGRASKPSTPAIGTFAEAAFGTGSTTGTTGSSSSRSRPSRNNNTDSGGSTASSSTTTGASSTTANASGQGANTTTTKRSHKKGASMSATAAQAAQMAQQAAVAASEEEEEDKIGRDRDRNTKEKDKDKEASTAAKPQHQHDQRQQPQQQQQSEKKNNGSITTVVTSNSKKRTRDNNSSNSSNGGGKNVDDRDHDNDNDVDEVDEDEDEDEDEEEPPADDEAVYCYCNQVSYGEMVACDGEGCPREWFHLECVGLKVAPKGNAKWYCEDCKKRLKVGERR